MAKRRQTTGMPTKSRQQNAESASTGDSRENASFLDRILGYPQTRSQREEALNRLLVRITVGSSVVIAALIIMALAYTFIYIPAQPVATVNGEAISVSEFQDRVRFERIRVQQFYINRVEQLRQFGIQDDQLQQFISSDPQLSQWDSELRFPDSLGSRVLDDLIDDRLIAQQAAELGITVDDADVEDTVNEFFGYDPTQVAAIGADPTETTVPTETVTPFVSPTPSPEPTMTPTPTDVPPEATAEVTPETTPEPDFPTPAPSPTPNRDEVQATYEANVDAFRQVIREQAFVGDSVTDAFFEREALRAAITESLLSEDESVPYVNLRHIQVATEEEAFEALTALENGELFGALATAISIDEQSASRGGELDWQPAESFVDAYQDALADLEPGALSQPVETEDGFYIIQLRAREERELEDFDLQQLQAARFEEWLENLRTENSEDIVRFDNWLDYIPQ